MILDKREVTKCLSAQMYSGLHAFLCCPFTPFMCHGNLAALAVTRA